MLGYSDIFLVDCTHIGFAPPPLSGAAGVLKSGKTISTARKAEVQIFKDSAASKKAWIKIHQKNALKGLDNLSKDIADMQAMPEGKAKQKAMDKISLKANHLEKKFLENEGDPTTFLDHQVAAYNKASSISPSTDPSKTPQASDQLQATTTPPPTPKSAPSPIQSTPKWDDPNGFEPDQVSHALDQNHKLGTAYYLSREKNGKDHPITQGVYAEWQKSKDYLKKGDGFDSGAAAIKSKDAASKQIQEEKAKAAQIEKNKVKAIDDVSEKAYQAAYHNAMDPNSHSAQQASDPLNNAKLIAELDGHDSETISAAMKAAKAKGEKDAAAKKAMQKVLDGGTASVLAYHDKTDFEDLSKYSSSQSQEPYAVQARSITDKLNEAQSQAIKSYGGSGYTEQNKAVAAGKTSNKTAEIMKKVMDKASLPVDAKLRRNMAQKWFWKSLGVGEDIMHNLSDAEMKSHVGKVFVEDAFSSTSKDPTFSAAFGKTASHSGKLKLNIRAPKGSQALDISYHVSNHGEAEIVLNRGATYVIRDIRKMSGHGTKGSSQFAYEADVDLIGFKPTN